jgi:hypothetical protein
MSNSRFELPTNRIGFVVVMVAAKDTVVRIPYCTHMVVIRSSCQRGMLVGTGKYSLIARPRIPDSRRLGLSS